MNGSRMGALRATGTALFLVAAGGSLSGCVAQVAHAVFAPALQSASEASQTRESLGITTSSWRGKSCKDLEFSYGYMQGVQRDAAASGDAHMAKVHGWQLDSIQEVRTEQGCLNPDGVPARPAAPVTAYGYCMEATNEHVYVTPVFTYGDYFVDAGSAETDAFRAMLASTYGESGNTGVCAMEDTAAKAQAAADRTASTTTLQLSRSTIRVNWTPPRITKAPKAAAAVASTPATARPTAGNSQSADPLGLTLQTPGPELVKALGLKDASGAWVVSVAPGSAAAKAGLKPMDVILDLSGQVVDKPADVATIAGKMRTGYPATVSIWRDRASRDVTLAIPAGLSAPAAPAPAPAVAAVAPQPVAAKPAAPARLEYCYQYLTSNDFEKHPDVLSPVFRDPAAGASAQSLVSTMQGFNRKVSQQQPGIWHDFDYKPQQCSAAAGVCFAAAQPLFGPKQAITLRCFASSEEAESARSADQTADPGATTIAMP